MDSTEAHVREKVLLVTESNEFRDILVQFIGSWGYESLSVGDPDEAEGVIESQRIALVVLDADFEWRPFPDAVAGLVDRWREVPTIIIVPSPLEEIYGPVPARPKTVTLRRPFEAELLRRLVAELLEGERREE